MRTMQGADHFTIENNDSRLTSAGKAHWTMLDSGCLCYRCCWGTPGRLSPVCFPFNMKTTGRVKERGGLAAAEQRVASFTSELAQQPRLAQPDAKPPQPIRTPIAKRGTLGWVAAG
jgi:hypothetical protein